MSAGCVGEVKMGKALKREMDRNLGFRALTQFVTMLTWVLCGHVPSTCVIPHSFGGACSPPYLPSVTTHSPLAAFSLLFRLLNHLLHSDEEVGQGFLQHCIWVGSWHRRWKRDEHTAKGEWVVALVEGGREACITWVMGELDDELGRTFEPRFMSISN